MDVGRSNINKYFVPKNLCKLVQKLVQDLYFLVFTCTS